MKKHALVILLVCLMGMPLSAGTMLREIWNQNLAIDAAEDLMNSGATPDVVDILMESAFDTYGEGYCARLSGWITVPESGSYQFHIASDDNGRFYVSQDEEVANAVVVAQVDSWTNTMEWDKFDTQHSDVMSLKKGQVMAVYATMQEGTGGDNLALGWTGPGLSHDIANPTLISEWVTDTMPERDIAANPSPAPDEEDVVLDAILSWSAGRFAATHNVYLGTVMEDVNQATVSNPLGVLVSQGQTETELDLGGFELGKTYYWRVDEVNAPPTASTIFKGDVWTFSAEPVAFPIKNVIATASSSLNANSGPEKTVDGSGLDPLTDQHSTLANDMWVSGGADADVWLQYEFDGLYQLNQMLVWNSNQLIEVSYGLGAKDVIVEHSVDGENWTVLEGAVLFNQASGSPDYTANTVIEFGNVMAKFVKIHITSNWRGILPTKSISEVRFLSIPVAARRPEPVPGATLEGIDDGLVWRAGRYAVQHEVYIGSDRALVEAGDASVRVATVTDRRYSLSSASLLYDQKYYWKIVELNGSEEPAQADGPIWDFNTPAYFVVDDMEAYDDVDNPIYYAWIDGYGDNTNGSTVGHLYAPFAEQDIAVRGQSMPLYYETSASVDASAELSLGGQNWTRGGVKTLVLHFFGDRENSGNGKLFVEINNKRLTHGSSLSLGLWKQWNIDLASMGINLSNVSSITVGVTGAGEGVVYIDEIGLYRDIADVAVPVDPGNTGLALSCKMENNVSDSSGNGLNGTAQGAPLYANSLAGLGMALDLDGIDDVISLPIGNLMASLSDSSFSIWVSIDPESDGSWMRVFDFGTSNANYLFMCPRTGTTGGVRVAILNPDIDGEDGISSDSALLDGWHHLACVFAAHTLTLYVDGLPIGTVDPSIVPADLGVTTQNWLGDSQYTADDYFAGMLDEFRIYSRALSEGEIRYLAGDR